MSQELLFNSEKEKKASKKLQIGINKVADAVKITLGARGRNVIIDKDYSSPQITKDGVTVAKSIQLSDPIENMGARLIIDIAHKTNEIAGDGTTTATVLAQSIFNEGLRFIDSGSNSMELKKGIDKAVKIVVDKLKVLSRPIGDVENIKRVATISANGDTEIGQHISGAIEMVSKDGVISIQESQGSETTLNVVEGMQFTKGYLSPYFVTDQAKLETVFINPIILFSSKRISLIQELIPVLEMSNKLERPLLIIAEEIDAEALNILIINNGLGKLKVCAVKAPSYGSLRREVIEDIISLTGGELIDDKLNMSLQDIIFEQLGQASKVIVTANDTTIIGGKGEKVKLEERVAIIRKQIESITNDFDKEKLVDRLAKLAGGVAVIYVGGSSEVVMKERKDRFEDALNATRAAISEGIVPGGGVALLRCIVSLEDIKSLNEDESKGVSVIRKTLIEPFKTIMQNAGQPWEVVLNNVMAATHKEVSDHGFNVATEKYELFFDTGVIDPTKVTRVALENAASVSGLLLTAECVVFNIKEEKKNE